MKVDYKITPDLNALGSQLTRNTPGARRAGMINVVTDIEARAIKYAPVKTSNLANSGTSDVNRDGSVGTVTFIAPYAEYVHRGTGLYGPHKTRIVSKKEITIVPKNAKGLFWPGMKHPVMMVKTTKPLFWPGMKHPVHSTKGMKANPFLLKAAQDTDIEKLYVEGAEHYLNNALRSAVHLED